MGAMRVSPLAAAVTQDMLIERLTAALPGCRDFRIESFDFGLMVRVGWTHEETGRIFGVQGRRAGGGEQYLVAYVQQHRAELLVRTCCPEIKVSRWQNATMLFRPKLRRDVEDRALLIAHAKHADSLREGFAMRRIARVDFG